MEQIPAGAVRIEELLNYFSYDYNLPKGKEPFGVTAVMGDCPWNSDARLLQIGLKTEEIDFGEAPDSNLVFLLDVSGSMYSQEKLPLLQRSFGLLAEELTEKDKVSIITYAGSDTIVLEGVSGDEKEKIREALDSLEASGSTNGAGAIESIAGSGGNRIPQLLFAAVGFFLLFQEKIPFLFFSAPFFILPAPFLPSGSGFCSGDSFFDGFDNKITHK